MQLIYGGQPFIFEKTLKLSSGEEKRFWRCNQWWNQKCRSRVFTINDVVCPLNRFHTHEEIVRRKKRVRRVPPVETISKVTPTARQQPHQPDQHQHQPQQQEIQLASDAMLTTTLEDESPATIDVSELGMHLKYEEIVADVTGIVGGATRVVSRRKWGRIFLLDWVDFICDKEKRYLSKSLSLKFEASNNILFLESVFNQTLFYSSPS